MRHARMRRRVRVRVHLRRVQYAKLCMSWVCGDIARRAYWGVGVCSSSRERRVWNALRGDARDSFEGAIHVLAASRPSCALCMNAIRERG